MAYAALCFGFVGLIQGVAWIGGFGAKSLPDARTRRWLGASMAAIGLGLFGIGCLLMQVPEFFSELI